MPLKNLLKNASVYSEKSQETYGYILAIIWFSLQCDVVTKEKVESTL